MAQIGKLLIFFIGLSLLLSITCKVNQKTKEVANSEANQKTGMTMKNISKTPALPPPNQVPTNNRIAPGTCRIIGKVVTIYPELEKDKNIPCGQVPCKALVQVQRVLGYGANFGSPLSEGENILVYFSFTLSSTKEFFPELNVPLPGLEVGDIFRADIQGMLDGKIKQYVVNTYFKQ